LKGTHEKEFAGYAATHEKFETYGADIFHFEGDKIKEVWTYPGTGAGYCRESTASAV